MSGRQRRRCINVCLFTDDYWTTGAARDDSSRNKEVYVRLMACGGGSNSDGSGAPASVQRGYRARDKKN